MNSGRAIAVAAILCLAGYLWVYGTGLAPGVIRSDGYSYYVYLPSWFLYHDTTLSEVARDCCGGMYPDHSGIVRWPGTRRWVNVHPIGVAIMQAPAFPVAHALTRWTNLTPDGFSLYYQHAAGLAGMAWTIAGLAILRGLLLRYFRDGVVAATILTILLGTNLLHYATFDVSYSHVYSFFLFAAFLYQSACWHDAPTTRRSALLGCTAGMIVLTRHTNAVFLAVFVLYELAASGSIRQGVTRLIALRRQLAIIAIVATLVVTPQLALYYQATGHAVINSYGDQGFRWASPRLFGVLFGVTKGLFFWSPLLLLSLVGFVLTWRTNHPARAFVMPSLLFLAVHTYLIAAWWDWQLGGSYGSRGYVDTLPVFAIGLAAFFERASATLPSRAATAVLVAGGVCLSVFQMLQYWYRIIPFTDTSWPLYREVFLRWR